MLVGGVDEAGRGPVLGPLVICGAIFPEDAIEKLEAAGVHDSKQLTRGNREALVPIIKQLAVDHELVVLEARDINVAMAKKTSLNDIEVEGFARAVNALVARNGPAMKVWMDAADVNPVRFKDKVGRLLVKDVPLEAMHKADETVIAVGAASIIAKCARDAAIESLQEKHGDLGSGYPSDPKTRGFLKAYRLQHGKFPPFARKRWETLRELEKELGLPPPGQSRLF